MRIRMTLAALICTAVALPAMAVESGPSNTVGFISWSCPAGEWTPFAFPFTYYNEGHVLTHDVNDILLGNFTPGDPTTADIIYDQNTMTSIYFTVDGWTGEWTEIVPGHAYWAKINNTEVMAVTAGEVDLTEVNLGTMEIGWNPVGLREPGAVVLENSGLIESGFTGGANPAESDRVYDQNALSYAWYNTETSSWVGLSDGLQPTHALWIWVHPNHAGFQWIYMPAGGSDNLVQPVPEVKKVSSVSQKGNQPSAYSPARKAGKRQ